jgi:hypothetical protein
MNQTETPAPADLLKKKSASATFSHRGTFQLLTNAEPVELVLNEVAAASAAGSK